MHTYTRAGGLNETRGAKNPLLLVGAACRSSSDDQQPKTPKTIAFELTGDSLERSFSLGFWEFLGSGGSPAGLLMPITTTALSCRPPRTGGFTSSIHCRLLELLDLPTHTETVRSGHKLSADLHRRRQSPGVVDRSRSPPASFGPSLRISWHHVAFLGPGSSSLRRHQPRLIRAAAGTPTPSRRAVPKPATPRWRKLDVPGSVGPSNLALRLASILPRDNQNSPSSPRSTRPTFAASLNL